MHGFQGIKKKGATIVVSRSKETDALLNDAKKERKINLNVLGPYKIKVAQKIGQKKEKSKIKAKIHSIHHRARHLI